MIPIISIVGKSDSGKTTLIEKLLVEFKSRGLKIATIKHDIHGFQMDKVGKDTWRHRKAGADSVIISSPQKLALIMELRQEKTLDELARMLTKEGIDLILTEGYKSKNKPKLEVYRSSLHAGILCRPTDQLFALACDRQEKAPSDMGVPVYDWNDAQGIADLIVEKFLQDRP